jgi:hypothetical protein
MAPSGCSRPEAHFPKPFFRKDGQCWYVQLRGKQIKLGSDQAAAIASYHDLMSQPTASSVLAPTRDQLLVVVIDLFLDWCKNNRETRTYEWYQERYQSFTNSINLSLSTCNSGLGLYEEDFGKEAATLLPAWARREMERRYEVELGEFCRQLLSARRKSATIWRYLPLPVKSATPSGTFARPFLGQSKRRSNMASTRGNRRRDVGGIGFMARNY